MADLPVPYTTLTKLQVTEELSLPTGAAFSSEAGIAVGATGTIGLSGAVAYGVGPLSLPDNSAKTLFTVTIADEQSVAGRVFYTLRFNDANEVHVESGIVTFAACRTGDTTYTTDVDESSSQAISNSGGGGTLATTWAVSGATGVITIAVTANTSLTPTGSSISATLMLDETRSATVTRGT